MQHKTLKALLKKNGASLTKPRKLIFDLLLNQKPQTMQVLVERAKGILQRELRVTEEEAYLTIQKQSRQRRKSMKEVAEAIRKGSAVAKKKLIRVPLS